MTTVTRPRKAVARVVKKTASAPAPRSRAASRPPQIQSVQDLKADGINMGIYSHPGAGKTVLWASHPNVLLLDCDSKGSLSAKALGSKADVWRIMDYTDLEEAYQYLRNGGTEDYDWYVWDSATLFQDRTLIDEITADAHEKNPSKQDRDVPSKREYFVSQNRIGRYMRQFVELPGNFGVSFHVGVYENPSGEDQWCPLLQGGQNMAFSTKMQGYLNVVGFYYVRDEGDERHRYLRTTGNQEYVAKDRFGKLPALYKNPTLPGIEKRIFSA